MVRVEMIKDNNLYTLESRINNFTNNNRIEIIDIKFETTYISESKQLYYAMIIYRERQING